MLNEELQLYSDVTFDLNLLFSHMQDDRSLINLHLMHTSYFLFVMVITMFCYAVIKGRPGKVRQSSPEFCPEKVRPSPSRQLKLHTPTGALNRSSVAGGVVGGPMTPSWS